MVEIPNRVKNLIPYKAGKSIGEVVREKHLDKVVKLASNENPLGPSPKALAAACAAISESHYYTDPASTELVQALAARYGKAPGQIICGHGVDSLLMYLILAFTDECDEILAFNGSFTGIYVNTRKLSRKLSLVDLQGYHYDLDRIGDSISPQTKILYLANPNNPTGSIFCRSEFESLMARVPKNILVILDEAYAEYATPLCMDFPHGMEYDFENLIVTRTFSKFHGLAGLRIGFAVGPQELIREMYKVKLPFEPNYLAQKSAIAALDDDEFMDRTLEVNNESLKLMRKKFFELGIEALPSYANFILLLLPTEEFAASFFEQCLDRGLIVRHVNAFGIPNGIRISSGTRDDTLFALRVIEEVYENLIQGSLAGGHGRSDDAA